MHLAMMLFTKLTKSLQNGVFTSHGGLFVKRTAKSSPTVMPCVRMLSYDLMKWMTMTLLKESTDIVRCRVCDHVVTVNVNVGGQLAIVLNCRCL